MSGPFRGGLVVLAVLSVFDLLLPFLSDGEHPPMAVSLAVAATGLISLALVIAVWRGAGRALPALIGVRVLSAVSAVPAFVMSGVPEAAVVSAAAIVALTAVGVVLILTAGRRADLRAAR